MKRATKNQVERRLRNARAIWNRLGRWWYMDADDLASELGRLIEELQKCQSEIFNMEAQQELEV